MSKSVVSRSPRTIQSVFVLLLLCLFACLSTFLVTVGAQVYRNTVDSAEQNNNSRIMTAVVRSAIWAEDGGKVQIERFDDLDITALKKSISILQIISKRSPWSDRLSQNHTMIQNKDV